MRIPKFLRRAARMCPAARRIQKLSLLTACTLLSAALFLLLGVERLAPDTYRTFRLVYALVENSSAVLLIGTVGAVCIEDVQS